MSIGAAVFDFHGTRIAITSTDSRILAHLASRLRAFLATSSDAPADITFEYEHGIGNPTRSAPDTTVRPVYDAPMGQVLYDDAADCLSIEWEGRLDSCARLGPGHVHTVLQSTGPEECWLASHPFFTLALLEQMKRHGLYGLHAALLARGDRALILPGGSGAGKSTLTLALLRAGFRFGGDDLCFLSPGEQGIRVLAFPDEVDVAEATIGFFPELRPLLATPRRPGAMKWPFLPEQVYTVDHVSACVPGALVFPRIGGVERSRLEPMEPAEALVELAPNVLLTHPARSQAHFDALGALIRQSDCWRLTTGRDFDAIPDLLEDLLRPEPTPI